MLSDPENTPAMTRAFRQILAPLATILMARGAPFQAAAEILKQAYVDAARRQSGEKLVVSRISVLTGLQRRDVKAIIEEPSEVRRKPGGAMARVLARWAGDPAFRDNGAPRDLPRLSAGDARLSFEGLCQAVSRDVHPRTMLDALVDMGAVEFDPAADLVSLKSAAFLSRDEETLLDYLGANLGDHAEAAAANLNAPDGRPPFFERAVHYDGLTPDATAELDATARELMAGVLVQLNERALELQQENADDETANQRFRAGAYVFSRTTDQEDTAK